MLVAVLVSYYVTLSKYCNRFPTIAVFIATFRLQAGKLQHTARQVAHPASGPFNTQGGCAPSKARLSINSHDGFSTA